MVDGESPKPYSNPTSDLAIALQSTQSLVSLMELERKQPWARDTPQMIVEKYLNHKVCPLFPQTWECI